MQSVNGAQFLNITPLSLSSNCLTVSSGTVSVIVIVPLEVYMHNYNHINLTLTLTF